MAASQTGEKKTDEKKYDRQLRLWGEEGQARLEAAKICLLNATASGAETLKNLVLPGIGHITIIDGQKVTESDFNNFFILESDLGKSRAQVLTTNLLELNPLVSGTHVDEDPVKLINNKIETFKAFSIVIACGLPEDSLLKLSKFLYDLDIPLVVIHAYGFIGYLRIARAEHTIVQAKPDNAPDDLRMSQPWAELEKAALSIDWSKLDSTQHSHMPYPFILISQMHKFKQEHNGKAPSTSDEKKSFRDGVLKAARKKGDEENFNEAYKSAHKAYTPVQIPSMTKSILADSKCDHLNSHSSNFWFLAAAVKEFVNNEGQGFLPLMGAIPDMTSTTDGYIGIQKLYAEKATRDVEVVRARLDKLLEKNGRNKESISLDDLKTFCKNANFLTLIRYRSLEQEFTAATAKASLISSQLQDSTSNASWYVGYRACLRFQAKHKRFPGENTNDVAKDAQELLKVATEFLHEIGIKDVTFDSKITDEMTRYGNCEMHNIAAFMGGVASQEVIKLVTHQYTPMDNTFIYNGIASTTTTLNL